jgi:putative ABC transport system permease protein
MGTLAWKNLMHDKGRLAVTLTGVVFALVLILAQAGLFLNFLDTSGNIVAHADADVWITAPDIPHINAGTPIHDADRVKALEVPGVERVERYILAWVFWKLPSGAEEMVQVIGFTAEGEMGHPWNIVAGKLGDVKANNAVIVDELYLSKLGVRGVGDVVEVNGRKAKVVGLTRGVRSFTTAPYMFTSFKNAQNYASYEFGPDETMFLLVRLKPGADVRAVQAALKQRLPDLDVCTSAEIGWRTQKYWVFETGAGLIMIAGSVLGLMVGVVVVAQTIYAATMDHVQEFGTLKAIGASNGRIYQVILLQAAFSAILGYVFALLIAETLASVTAESLLPILLPREVAVAALGLSLAMCMGAAMVAVRKATHIDPAMVFRG